MPQFKKIAYAAWNAASAATLTSVVTLETGWDAYAIGVPAGMFAAAQSSTITPLFCDTFSGTFRPFYISNPSLGIVTVTCAMTFNKATSLATMAVSGGVMEMNSLKYCPGYVQFQADSATTNNTGITVYGKVGY
jgi:hypothetical protein